MLLRDQRGNSGDLQLFPGVGINGAQDATPSTGPLDLIIDLDATDASSDNWTISFSVGNSTLASDQAISGDPSTIGFVGFSLFEGMGGTVSDLKLEIIPEPSTYALIRGLLACSMGALRRSRRS